MNGRSYLDHSARACIVVHVSPSKTGNSLALSCQSRTNQSNIAEVFPCFGNDKMKIQYGSVFGNYKWSAEAEVPDALIPTLLGLGALQVAQRSPSSAAEKAIAGYDKRPKGFNRTQIPFSEAGAETLMDALRLMKVETGRNEKDEPIYATITANVSVEQYVPTEADVKMNDERAAYGRNAEKLDKLAAKVGYAGDLGNGKPADAPVEFLRAIRAWSKAQIAALG